MCYTFLLQLQSCSLLLLLEQGNTAIIGHMIDLQQQQ